LFPQGLVLVGSAKGRVSQFFPGLSGAAPLDFLALMAEVMQQVYEGQELCFC
jgi:hypothetical protein